MAARLNLGTPKKGTIGYALDKLFEVENNINSVAARVLKRPEQGEFLLEHQRDQMYAGLDARGGYIRPYYTDDPYFHSKESARRYAEWKMRLNQRRWPPYIKKRRPMEVPNLIITGRLIYDNISLRVTQRYVKFELPTFDIRAKYGQVLGLSPLVLDHYRRRCFLPAFYAELSRQLL